MQYSHIHSLPVEELHLLAGVSSLTVESCIVEHVVLPLEIWRLLNVSLIVLTILTVYTTDYLVLA